VYENGALLAECEIKPFYGDKSLSLLSILTSCISIVIRMHGDKYKFLSSPVWDFL